jgi:hypothetical protein
MVEDRELASQGVIAPTQAFTEWQEQRVKLN